VPADANRNKTRVAPQGQSQRNVLVLCPTHRDYRELPRLRRANTRYIFHDYASTALEDLIGSRLAPKEEIGDPLVELQRILSICSDSNIHAVVSTDDYPGSALAAAIAKHLGLWGPDPALSLVSQHKYLARIEQLRHVPEAVPTFALIDTNENAPLPASILFPAFVKPVKSFFSIGARLVNSPEALHVIRRHWAKLDAFFLPFERLLQRYAGAHIGTNRLILETVLPGVQVTVEGYVSDGEISILGVVDSIFFPGTLAFSRFEYPSSLPLSVQERMGQIARRLILGLGFDNGMFNIEMAYDAGRDCIGVIEINPRMASQFADLYEKVDGTNSYEILLDIGQGHRPVGKRRQGRHALAVSFVLRIFEDRYVSALPSEATLEALSQRHPDIRLELHARLGSRLSDEMQDGHSYRYGIINLGGRDRTEILQKFEDCRQRLGIRLLPIRSIISDAEAMGLGQLSPESLST
jgi:biotin carboxylase